MIVRMTFKNRRIIVFIEENNNRWVVISLFPILEKYDDHFLYDFFNMWVQKTVLQTDNQDFSSHSVQLKVLSWKKVEKTCPLLCVPN